MTFMLYRSFFSLLIQQENIIFCTSIKYMDKSHICQGGQRVIKNINKGKRKKENISF